MNRYRFIPRSLLGSLCVGMALPLVLSAAQASPGSEAGDALNGFIASRAEPAQGADVGSADALGHFMGARQLLFTNRRLPEAGQPEALALPQQPNYALEQGQSSYGLGGKAQNRLFDEQTLMMSDVVLTAMGYLGKPYSYGKSSMEGGFDCSGFVLSLYERSVGLRLPRRAVEQAHATTKISKSELKPGDLVFFNTMRRQYSHVGIYIGEGRFIHSPRAGSRIRVESMEKAYWQSRFNGARRVVVADAGRLPGAR